MEKSYKYTVCTQCFTYNQASYILDTLNGFVAQQTDFPVVYTIVDDASTDGEPQILRDYFNEHFCVDNSAVAYHEEADYGTVLYGQHKVKKNCFFAILLLNDNHYSQRKSKSPYISQWRDEAKYIALCEGDDYWIDSHKLHKQVEFLEQNNDYSMCFHAATVLIEDLEDDRVLIHCENIVEREYSSSELFNHWTVPTASIVYRKAQVSAYKLRHPEWITRGDISIILKCAHVGRVYGFAKKMSVYRMHSSGVTYDQARRKVELSRLPNHFRCIYYNFPKVNRGPIRYRIAYNYFLKSKQDTAVIDRIHDLLGVWYWCPKYAFRKSVNGLRQLFHFHS